jgi:hypothetical protein
MIRHMGRRKHGLEFLYTYISLSVFPSVRESKIRLRIGHGYVLT